MYFRCYLIFFILQKKPGRRQLPRRRQCFGYIGFLQRKLRQTRKTQLWRWVNSFCSRSRFLCNFHSFNCFVFFTLFLNLVLSISFWVSWHCHFNIYCEILYIIINENDKAETPKNKINLILYYVGLVCVDYFECCSIRNLASNTYKTREACMYLPKTHRFV